MILDADFLCLPYRICAMRLAFGSVGGMISQLYLISLRGIAGLVTDLNSEFVASVQNFAYNAFFMTIPCQCGIRKVKSEFFFPLFLQYKEVLGKGAFKAVYPFTHRLLLFCKF